MAATERLQLGLLVGADHVLVGAQPAALEAALVEVEHACRPSAAKSGSRGKIHERCCQGLIAASCSQRQIVDRRRVGDAALDHQPMQLSAREAAERQAVGGRQLARDRLDLGDLLRGENGAGDPRVGDR